MTTHVCFDTPAGITATERFDFWRTWYGQAIDAPMRLDPLGPLPSTFHAGAEVVGTGDVDLIELRCGPASGQWDRQATEPTDRLRLVLLAPSPGGVGCWQGRHVSVTRGCVVLLGRTEGWWRVPAGLHGMQVNLPRAAFPVSDAELARMNDPGLQSRDPVLNTMVRPMLAGLAGHLGSLAGMDGAELGTVWTALLRMLLRSLAGQDVDGADLTVGRRAAAQRYIGAHLADPRLSADTVAAALHVSRRSLYACLPGVAEHIRRARLARASELLTDPALSIGQVSAAVGLSDAAHFSRIFRAEYGRSPSDVRARPDW